MKYFFYCGLIVVIYAIVQLCLLLKEISGYYSYGKGLGFFILLALGCVAIYFSKRRIKQ
jgi:hypothetical protein